MSRFLWFLRQDLNPHPKCFTLVRCLLRYRGMVSFFFNFRVAVGAKYGDPI
jgi:hypothetical protein